MAKSYEKKKRTVESTLLYKKQLALDNMNGFLLYFLFLRQSSATKKQGNPKEIKCVSGDIDPNVNKYLSTIIVTAVQSLKENIF